MKRLAAVIPVGILLTLAIAFACVNGLSAATATSITGNWSGILGSKDSGKLHIAVHIKRAEDGTFTGTLDSIDQKSFGIPIQKITYEGRALHFECPAVKGHYEGKMNRADSEIDGTWSQAGESSLPLNLTRAK